MPSRLADGSTHTLPRFDRAALEIEVDLLLDWYWPEVVGGPAPAAVRDEFHELWAPELDRMLGEPVGLFLRDYHSPNLFWRPDREGMARVGLIDFQDALIGPPAYDVASLLMDARCTVSEKMEVRLLSRYAVGRHNADPAFDPARFAAQYVVMGAQRATKILGIFARLDKRDGKPQYLRHMPRVWNYLMRALEHPSLSAIKGWYAANLPPPPGVKQVAPEEPELPLSTAGQSLQT